MKDLIQNDEVGLIESEINEAIAKDKNAKAIVTSTEATGKAKKTQRAKVRASLEKVSLDGKSYAGLHEVELAMNKLKVKAIKSGDDSDMKSLKSCIEKVFVILANDENFPFHTMENRKSMKNVTIKNPNQCRMSDVLPEQGGNGKGKNAKDEPAVELSLILNLQADDDNNFYSNNKGFFDAHCEVENGELVIDDETLNYTFSLVENMKKELMKMRKNAVAEWHKKVDEIVAKADSKN